MYVYLRWFIYLGVPRVQNLVRTYQHLLLLPRRFGLLSSLNISQEVQGNEESW